MIKEPILYRRYDFSFKKAYKNVGQIFTILDDIASQYRDENAKRNFIFGEAGGKVSPTERALRRFPSLKEFQFETAANNRLSSMRGVGNLSGQWSNKCPSNADIDLATLSTIANGIPRSFPFLFATFLWDQLNWGHRKSKQFYTIFEKEGVHSQYGARGFYSPCIMFFSHRGAGRRSNYFSFIFDFPASELADCESIPKYSQPLKIAKTYGRQLRMQTYVGFPTEMALVNQAKQEELQRLFAAQAGNAVAYFQNSTRYQQHGRWAAKEYLDLKLLPALRSKLDAIGYKAKGSNSDFGTYKIYSKTKANNYLVLELYVGPSFKFVDYQLMIKGFNVDTKVGFPLFIRGDGEIYRPTLYSNDDTLSVSNKLMISLKFLSENLAEKIDEICGQSPRWYSPFA